MANTIWNTATKVQFNLSNQSLSALNTGTPGFVWATNAIQSTGTRYWSLIIAQASTDVGLGFANTSATTGQYLGYDANAQGYHSNDGNIYYGGAIQHTGGATFTAGDVIGFAVNMTSATFTVYKNGVPQYSNIPVTASGTLYPAMGAYTLYDGATVNFDTAPSGVYGYDSALSLSAGSFTVGSVGTTWNPSDKGANITLSTGNLTATGVDSNMVRATNYKTTGNWYWSGYIKLMFSNIWIGVADSSATLSNYLGQDAHGLGYVATSGNVYQSAGIVFTGGATYTTGDVVGIAYNSTNNTVSFYKNGAIQYTSVASGLTGNIFPAVSLNDSDSVVGNFYGGPAGYFGFDSQGYQIGTPSGFFMMFQ